MNENEKIPCINCICLSTCKARMRSLPDNRSMYMEVLDQMSKKCSILKEFIWVDERAAEGKLSYIPGRIHWTIRFMTSNDKESLKRIEKHFNENCKLLYHVVK